MITISTLYCTYIVPTEKESALVSWLQSNAIKQGAQQLQSEVSHPNYPGQVLLNESR